MSIRSGGYWQRTERDSLWSTRNDSKEEVVQEIREGDGRCWGSTGNPLCGVTIQPSSYSDSDGRDLQDWFEETDWESYGWD